MVPAIGDFEVARNLKRVPYPYTDDDARAFLRMADEGWSAGTFFAFAIEHRASARLIGGIGCVIGGDEAAASQVAACGYWLARSEWGRGYGREALARLVRFAFHELDPPLARLEANAHAGNIASQRVLIACGFEQAGECVETCAATGQAVRALRFELRA